MSEFIKTLQQAGFTVMSRVQLDVYDEESEVESIDKFIKKKSKNQQNTAEMLREMVNEEIVIYIRDPDFFCEKFNVSSYANKPVYFFDSFALRSKIKQDGFEFEGRSYHQFDVQRIKEHINKNKEFYHSSNKKLELEMVFDSENKVAEMALDIITERNKFYTTIEEGKEIKFFYREVLEALKEEAD